MENNLKTKIKSFTDLNAWREGHKLVLMIYAATEKLPKKEIFCLVIQMRRAVISITSNIAEGFSRRTNKEKCQFYSISHGSLTEIQNQLLITRDLGYIGREEFNKIAAQTVSVHKLITGLKKSICNT